MSSPFIGEIRIVGFTFAPRGWALCSGQLLAISQNTALFSILGTDYGGNGTSTFGLPDFRGRVPMFYGQGPGLSNYVRAQAGGVETVSLATTQIPSHSHTVNANSGAATNTGPGSNFLAGSGGNAYATTGGSTMAATTLGNTGSGQGHENRQPFLVLNFIIALQGIFPSRN
ncbi:MAG: tail fiber protein [Blastocatellia bacterium]|nr:tail fiber protein [Blastocatellia bacterium]